MATKVLVIEDDPDTVEIVSMYLTAGGRQVVVAADGLQGVRLAQEDAPDLVILDLMLPGLDGFEICRQLRAVSRVPIIMLTARVEQEDRIAGLTLGADDYVTKPFHPRELVARVEAVLRRADPGLLDSAQGVLSHGPIAVDLRSYETTVSGTPVHLTPTEMKLLVLFLRSPGRVLTREQLLDRVFDGDSDSFDRTIDTHISNLRHKLAGGAEGQRHIRTVRGVGYKLDHD